MLEHEIAGLLYIAMKLLWLILIFLANLSCGVSVSWQSKPGLAEQGKQGDQEEWSQLGHSFPDSGQAAPQFPQNTHGQTVNPRAPAAGPGHLYIIRTPAHHQYQQLTISSQIDSSVKSSFLPGTILMDASTVTPWGSIIIINSPGEHSFSGNCHHGRWSCSWSASQEGGGTFACRRLSEG